MGLRQDPRLTVKVETEQRLRFSSGPPPLTSAPPRAARPTPENRAWRGNGTRGHQHCHGPVKTVTEGLVNYHPGEEQDHNKSENGGHETRSKRSVKSWVGDFCASASLTVRTTRASVVSAARRVT